MTHETRTITDNLDQLLAILPSELEKRCVVHLNDSKGAAGKHLDRHEHIGEGTIGRDAMRALLTHPQLRDKPFILETPEVETMIEENLMTVRKLRGGRG